MSVIYSVEAMEEHFTMLMVRIGAWIGITLRVRLRVSVSVKVRVIRASVGVTCEYNPISGGEGGLAMFLVMVRIGARIGIALRLRLRVSVGINVRVIIGLRSRLGY